MPNRRITSNARGCSVQLTDCLHSLFALELMCPSPEIYLISPWISNVPLISNRFGQFRAVIGDSSESDELRIATILSLLAERGTKVRILHRPHPQIQNFLQRLSPLVELRQNETLHEKGLITKYGYLRGSMNFTYSGVNLNDEMVELTTEPTDISYALLEARQRWKESAQ